MWFSANFTNGWRNEKARDAANHFLTASKTRSARHLRVHRIYEYIASENVRAARSTVETLEETCGLFGQHPEIGQRETGYSTEIRSFTRGSYVIFYRVTAEQIDIVRILHGARDRTDLME
jgi:toxin ParE1/3/4